MGVLAASGMMNGSNGEPSSAPLDDEPVAAAEEPATREPAAEPAPKPDFVPFSAVEGKQPGGRRNKTQEQIDERLKKFEDTWSQQRQTYESKISEMQAQQARLLGQVEALTRMPQQQQPAPQKPGADEDPSALRKRAREALDAGKWDEYDELNHKAAVIAAERSMEQRIAPQFEEVRRAIPQPVDPMIQYLVNSHQNVAMAGLRGLQAVDVKERELAVLYNVPPGPERLQRAFDLAEKSLAQQRTPQASPYGQDAAQALSAVVPTSRPSASGGSRNTEEGHQLTPVQEDTRRNLGWTKEEYIRWMYPDRFRK